MMNNRDKLFKLMQENPGLPIVVISFYDCRNASYPNMLYEIFSCDIVTIYKINDEVFDNITDIKEYYEALYESEWTVEEDEYGSMTDIEWDKKIEKLVEETPHYKAIRIYCS